MPDLKISQLPAVTSLAGTDLFAVATTIVGVPTTARVTYATVRDAVFTGGMPGTVLVGDDGSGDPGFSSDVVITRLTLQDATPVILFTDALGVDQWLLGVGADPMALTAFSLFDTLTSQTIFGVAPTTDLVTFPVGVSLGFAAGAVVIGHGAGAMTAVSPTTAGNVLTSNGPGNDPTWETPDEGTVTHSAGALTASALVVGNGVADLKVLASLGTTTTLLHGNAAGLPTWGAVSLTADVSGDLPFANMVPATAISVLVGRGASAGAGDFQEITLGSGLTMTGTVLSASGGGSGTVTHTLGALTTSALVVGNGAADLDVLASLGTTTTVLHGNAAGRPTFGAVVEGDFGFTDITTANVSNTAHGLCPKSPATGSVLISGTSPSFSSSPTVTAIRVTAGGTSGFNWGTTSSVPKIINSTTTVQLRLADDSGDAPLQAGAVTFSGTETLTGNFIFAAAGVIRRNTADALDNSNITIAGGGATGQTRGAQVVVWGNEGAGNPGNINLIVGNVTGSSILMTKSDGTQAFSFLGSTGATTFASAATFSQGLVVDNGVTSASGAITVTPLAGSNLNVVLSTTGDFTVNTNLIYADTSAGTVGIGSSSPLSKLSINGGLHVGGDADAGDNNLYVDGTSRLVGNVGIGGSSTALHLQTFGTGVNDGGKFGVGNSDATDFVAFYGGQNNDANSIMFWSAGNTFKMGTATAPDGTSFAERFALSNTGALKLAAYTATTFVAGDKFLVVDASGNVHVSGLGPVS